MLIPDTFSFRKNELQVTKQTLLVAVGSALGTRVDEGVTNTAIMVSVFPEHNLQPNSPMPGLQVP